MRSLVGLISLAVLAAAPAGTPSDYADWFRSLMRPGSGTSCCSVADCRRVRSFIASDRTGRDYWVLIDRATFGQDAPNRWVMVPPDKILPRTDNPTGEAILCWHGVILCFVRGPEV